MIISSISSANTNKKEDIFLWGFCFFYSILFYLSVGSIWSVEIGPEKPYMHMIIMINQNGNLESIRMQMIYRVPEEAKLKNKGKSNFWIQIGDIIQGLQFFLRMGIYEQPESQIDSEEEQSQSKYCPKKKKIRKDQRKKITTGVKRGRPQPSKFREFQIKESEEQNIKIKIQKQFFDFEKNTGMRKGFVFDQEVRKQLIQMQKRDKEKNIGKIPTIEWNQTHKWKPLDQRSKVNKIIRRYEVPGQKLKQLQYYLFEIGEIFASEITEEIYDFLMKIIHFCFFQTDKNFHESKGKICEQVMEEYKFLNQKFTTKNFKHKIIRVKEEKLKEELVSLEQNIYGIFKREILFPN